MSWDQAVALLCVWHTLYYSSFFLMNQYLMLVSVCWVLHHLSIVIHFEPVKLMSLFFDSDWLR